MGHSHSHHSHADGHHHDHGQTDFSKAFAIAVTLNLLFTIIEALYAVSANSMSLLADAAHNLGDVLGLVCAWGANWLLTLPSSERYSYGYKRTSILASLTNALILFATSALIAYESINKLMHPSQVHEQTIMIVAFIGILVNGGTALLFFKGRKDDLNIKGAFLHLAGDALIALGVVAAGAIVLLTGWYWVDPAAGLFIVVIIVVGTWGLLRDSVDLILDAVPSHISQNKVREYLTNIPGVTGIHDIHIWGLSTKEVALTAHLIVPGKQISDRELHDICNTLKHNFGIHHPTLQQEKGADERTCPLDEVC